MPSETEMNKEFSADPAVVEREIEPSAETDASAPEQPAQPLYKMQDLMQDIAGQSELKRSDLRDVAGLVTAALGKALDEGRAISLPGLGKITPRKRDSKPSGDLLTARIKLARRGDAEAPEGEAEAAKKR